MYRLNKHIKRMIMAAFCLFGIWHMGMTVEAASADNSLSSLTISEGTLSPSFAYNIVKYTATVSADTQSVQISARTSNAAASIQSGTGTVSLKEGTNTANVVVMAENGNLATYTITITRGGGAPQGGDVTPTDTPSDDGQDGTDTPEDGGGEETPPGDPVITGAEGYTVSSEIPQEAMLSGFEETTVTYEGEEKKALRFEHGDVTLLYMTDEEGNGDFFVYEAGSGSVYPFVRLTAGSHFLILQRQSMDASLDGNYLEESLIIDGKQAPIAYQSTTENDMDYYLVYGINSDGVSGWYQYDSAEGTYQRYRAVVQQEEIQIEETDEYKFLQGAYNDLSLKYEELKDKDTKFIAGLLIAAAILVIIVVNLLLFGRGKRASDAEEKDVFSQEKKTVKSEKSKPEKIKSEKVKPEKKWVDEEERDLSFEDDDDFLNFEDEPEFGFKRKEKKAKKKRFGKRADIFETTADEDDGFYDEEVNELTEDIRGNTPLEDELEILDLNDL